MLNQIIHNDCLEVLKEIPDNYFDSLITDPPSSISFMNKEWDKDKGGMLNWINWLSEIMSESLRVIKPGACGLVWSLPRTSHWTGMALELAGFKVIDIVHVAQGQGFPKGQCLSKQIDQLLGEEREIIGDLKSSRGIKNTTNALGGSWQEDPKITSPSSPEAKFWDGWKTAQLKPAVENWWLVQKPISESSIARNILKHGVGGLNIDACRISIDKDDPNQRSNGSIPISEGGKTSMFKMGGRNPKIKGNTLDMSSGRFPSNLILSCGANCIGDDHSPDCPISVIGEQSGLSASIQNKISDNRRYARNKIYGGGLPGERNESNSYEDKGTSARFFKNLPFDPETIPSIYYQSKASPKDRSSNGKVKNIHPTVKSRHLMKYLITLITPKDGIVLDPFCGSGTTAIACKELGFNYVCIEKEKEYFDIACDRINQVRDYSEIKEEDKEEGNKEEEIKDLEDNQLSLF